MRMLFLCSSDRFNITLDDGLLLRGISDTRAVSVYLVRHFVHITHSLVFLRTYFCRPSFMGTFQIAWVTVHIGPTTAGVILDVASGDTGDITGAIWLAFWCSPDYYVLPRVCHIQPSSANNQTSVSATANVTHTPTYS